MRGWKDQSKRGRRIIAVSVVVAVCLALTAVAIAQATDVGPRDGEITEWNVKDESGDPYPSPVGVVTPLAYTVPRDALTVPTVPTEEELAAFRAELVAMDVSEEDQQIILDAMLMEQPEDLLRPGRRAGRIHRFHAHNRTGDRHRPRGRMVTTERALPWCRNARGVTYGGDGVFNYVVVGVSQQFCYRSHQGEITSFGTLHSWALVLTPGTWVFWGTDDPTPPVQKTNSRACDGSGCWEYGFRRALGSFSRGAWFFQQHANGCVAITMRGTGRVIVSKGCPG